MNYKLPPCLHTAAAMGDHRRRHARHDAPFVGCHLATRNDLHVSRSPQLRNVVIVVTMKVQTPGLHFDHSQELEVLSPIHTADETKLSSLVASAVCT